MNDLRQVAQAALDAMESLLAKVRRDAPQLSGKLMGHCENVNAQLRAALAQPDSLPGMSPINRSIAYSAAQTLRDLGYEWGGDKWAQPQPEQHAAPAVSPPDRAELSDAWAALLDAGESPICEDDTVANAIRRLTGRSLTLTVSTDTTFHGNYRITDGGRSRGVTIARSDLADDMSDSDLRDLLSEACDDAAHQSIRVEPLDVEAFLKWARS